MNESALVAAEWYYIWNNLKLITSHANMNQRFKKKQLQNNFSDWTPTKMTMAHLNLWFNCGRYKFASDQRFKNPKSWNCRLLQSSTLILVTICQYMLICKSIYVTIKRILCSSKTLSSKLGTCGFLRFGGFWGFLLYCFKFGSLDRLTSFLCSILKTSFL